MVEKPSRMCESDGEAHPDVREWSGGPFECLEMVGWTSRMSGSGREAHPDGRECSRSTPE